MAEIDKPTIIDPFLNTAYWAGKELGDEAEPWPETNSLDLLEFGHGANFLATYVRQGASQLALTRFEHGQTFDADNLALGTILLSAVESVGVYSKDPVTPMSQFAEQPLPDRRPVLADEKLELSGHGYSYSTRHWINVITRGSAGVCLIDPDKVRVAGEPDKKEFMKGLSAGIRAYTVGETYSFESKNDDREPTLIRVNELIVVMHGLKPKGKGIRGLLFGGKLATDS